jgi:citrate lyase subunit beta / citryl-CoA lyase
MSVPASSERFLAKARGLPVDEVMLDLEDSVAPGAKPAARELAVAALRAGGWDGKLVAVRVNDATTPWAYQDVIAVTEGAPGAVDTLILPKVSGPGAVIWLDVLLGQLERFAGLAPGRIGIEAQIEDAAGLAAVEAIAAASPRLVALVFGPADFMASIGMRSLTVGGQPAGYRFDAHHYPLMRLLVAAKARGLQAIDGPYAKIGDTGGLRAAAASAAALGYDGKWVLHPAQVDIVNDEFTPPPDDYARAARILEAYERATTQDRRGAVMLDGEMIDEASRKLALAIVAKGRAAGLLRVDLLGVGTSPVGMRAVCPRCGSKVHAPTAWSSAWRCDLHGEIYPLAPARLPTMDGLQALVRHAKVPVWLPWPLPTGWLVSGFTGAGDERSGTRGSALALSGPNPLGGPAEMLIVAEEPGVGLGAGLAGLPGPDPGDGFAASPPHASVKVANHEAPLWLVESHGQAVFVGEVAAHWLWLVLWPDTAGTLLVEPLSLRDLRAPEQDLDVPFGALSPRLPG